MNSKLLYVELKSGHNDNGPAWIGRGTYSKSGSTIYFNGRAFQSLKGGGVSANFFDIETGDEYWISGVKKNQHDRHWAGSGIIKIDSEVVPDYLKEIGAKSLDERKFRVTEFISEDPRLRIHSLKNEIRPSSHDE